MKNSALALLAMFETWREQQGSGQVTPANARGWGDPGVASQDARRAMALLDAVERDIVALETTGRRMRVARDNLVAWTQIVLAYPSSWQQNAQAEQVVPRTALDHLESLGELIDASQLEFDVPKLVELHSILDEAVQLVVTDESLDPRLRSYIVDLIREMRNALDDASIGDGFEFRRATERLWVAFGAAAGASSEPANWKKVADKIAFPTVVGLAIHAGGVGIDAAAKMLGVS